MAKRRPLTDHEKACRARLQTIWDRKKDQLGLTQEKAADLMGYSTQGAVGHYLNGNIPLNLKATLNFARILEVSPYDIDEELGRFVVSEPPVQYIRVMDPDIARGMARIIKDGADKLLGHLTVDEAGALLKKIHDALVESTPQAKPFAVRVPQQKK